MRLDGVPALSIWTASTAACLHFFRFCFVRSAPFFSSHLQHSTGIDRQPATVVENNAKCPGKVNISISPLAVPHKIQKTKNKQKQFKKHVPFFNKSKERRPLIEDKGYDKRTIVVFTKGGSHLLYYVLI